MNLYIETENGVTKNHPAFEDNLLQAFGSIPAHWEPFTRVERPTLTAYQLLENQESVYTLVNGTWMDTWSVRDMTTEEKIAKQQATITAFNEQEYASNWSTWVLNEAICIMQPPIPRPAPVENSLVLWCGADNNWKEAPACPEGEYKFDFIAWVWVAL
jgi:hypothetical protein